MSRHLTIRLQLVWLTLATLAAFALMGATRPEGDVVAAEFARNLDAFRRSLGPDPSLAALNQFRASLAADMVFLLAYGLLLRQSVLYTGGHRWNRRVRRMAVAAMMADATENIAALAVLRTLGEPAVPLPLWVFPVMNTASITKWTLVGGVMLFLAARWRALLRGLTGAVRYAGWVVALAFAAGGLGSLAVATSFWFAPVRAAAAAATFIGFGIAALLQFRLLDLVGVALRFVYLARVPFIVLLLTAGFGPIALGPANRLLGAVLDVPTPRGIAVVTATALVLAFACATQANLVRAYAAQRTFDRTLRVVTHRVMGRAIAWTALAAVSSLLFSVGLASLWISIWQVGAGVLGGAAFGLVFLFVLEWLSLRISESRPGHPMPQLPIPFAQLPLVGHWLRRAHAAPAPPAIAAIKRRAHRWSIAGLFGLSSGYIEVTPDGTRRLMPGHTFAIIQLALSLVVYSALIFGKSLGGPSVDRDLLVPTASSITLLLLLNSWGLSGITFFLDRYRVPLFSAVLALTLVTGSRACTDYEASPIASRGDHYELATPADVLSAFPRPLVLASAGGGIQAGAWAARVLEGIDTALREGGGGGLRERAALVSGVSGGSMGALYYGAYQDTGLSEATRRSLEPSLDEIASALIGVDQLRRVFAVRVGVDRGAALERSWALRLPTGPDQITLRAWADRVRRFAKHEDPAPFPAFLFNTTIVETGAPMGFVTTQLPTRAYRDSFLGGAKQYPVAESVNGVLKLSADGVMARDVGLEMVTAARLSAAFPYVSPATALVVDGSERFHLVDGGYYDNYGLAAVTQWLDDALEGMASPPAEVGVVIIRGLTESGDEVVDKLREGEQLKELPAMGPKAASRGWAWQLVAPPSAFLRTRSFGQWAGGMQALKLLAEKWRPRVAIRLYLFDFPAERLSVACQAAPLSWKLSNPQQACINEGWDKVAPLRSDLLNPVNR